MLKKYPCPPKGVLLTTELFFLFLIWKGFRLFKSGVSWRSNELTSAFFLTEWRLNLAQEEGRNLNLQQVYEAKNKVLTAFTSLYIPSRSHPSHAPPSNRQDGLLKTQQIFQQGLSLFQYITWLLGSMESFPARATAHMLLSVTPRGDLMLVHM